jgi:hypothetical protein
MFSHRFQHELLGLGAGVTGGYDAGRSLSQLLPSQTRLTSSTFMGTSAS